MSDLVLVTGGAGFVGSHLCKRLLQRGYRVRVLDNLSLGRREWVPDGAEFIQGDIRDLPTCHKVCAGVSGIFHTAVSPDQVSGPSRPGDSRETLADISHTLARLNWKPGVTPDDGLTELKYLVRQGLE
jgi:UDP-glucose 4-epimerase